MYAFLKSYIGVCLVLALDVIRKRAENDGHAVGPILVLSYKNHALDEFLIDFISQYDATYAHGNHWNSNSFHRLFAYYKIQPGMLIRTGKPDIESLYNFTERFSPLERRAQDYLASVILVQRQARNIIKAYGDCARIFESNSFNDVSNLKRNLF